MVGGDMKKRDFLQAAATGVTFSAGAASLTAHAQNGPAAAMGPILLTVSGLIGAGNRGALDPALDQLMVKKKLSFSKAHVFDFAALIALPPVTIKPTLEYDSKPHVLKGPLLLDVMKASGAQVNDQTSLLLRAVDGYAVVVPVPEVAKRRFIVATHLDGRPMSLGGLGPLWSVYEADAFPDMAAKPVQDRFSLCPWATYHIEVRSS
jgi:hypothetical protein